MKAEKLRLKLGLNEANMDHIKKAIQEAEEKSSGEIAVAAIDESDDYSFYELFASLIGGILVFAAFLPFSPSVAGWIDSLFWDFSILYVLIFYGLLLALCMTALFLVFNIPALDRFIIPRRARSEAVYRRALQCFIESGVYATKENNGVLIFISLLEHEVRIIADSGLLRKIDPQILDALAKDLAAGIKTGDLFEVLIKTIDECGRILAEEFPSAEKPENQLADGMFLLER